MGKKNDISLSPLKITFIYLIVAALWIVFTDRLLESLVADAYTLSILQTYKGWLYVVLTSLGLYFLIKANEKQLRDKEQKLRGSFSDLRSEKELNDILFDRIPVFINIYDPDLEVFRINNEFEEVIGWSQEEVNEIDFMEASFPDFELRKEAVTFMNKPGIGWKEIPMKTKSGEIIPTSWTNIKLTDETLVAIGIDMSEIRASQAKLRESQEMLTKTFESLQSSVIILDMTSRTIIKCNSATEEIFGYSRDELIGSSTRKLHVNATQFMLFGELSRNKLLKDGIFETEFEMKRNDGTIFYSQHTITIVRDEKEKADKVVSVVRDISEQKKYRNELERRNKFIETILDNLPIGVTVNKIDSGKATLINNTYSVIYGWPEDILTDPELFYQSVYPDEEYREQIVNTIQKDIASHNTKQMQWDALRIQTKEGEEKIINLKYIPLYEQNLMISTVEDVTALHQAGRENRRLSKVLQNSLNELYIFDTESYTFNYVNKGALINLDYSRDELMEMEVMDIKPQFTKETFGQLVKPLLEKQKDKIVFETTHRRANGTTYPVEIHLQLLEQQNANLFVAVVLDITDRKIAEQKLRESGEKYRHLFENNPEPMWIYDPDTLELVEVNQAAIDHYGYSEKEFLNMSLVDIRPEEEIKALKQNVKDNRGRVSYSEVWKHLKKDGSEIIVKLSAADVKYKEDKTYRLVLINDITEQKRLQEKIIQSVIEGEDRERKRIAHELHDGLGQSLVAASMNLQSAKADIENLSPKRQKQFETGVTLLKEALSETRSIAHNLMPKVISDYGLLAALENLVKNFQKSTEIEFHFDHNCEELKLDNQAEINIYRIVQETVSNAVRHAQCSTVNIELQLKKNTLNLTIKDDGIGAKLDRGHENKGLGLRSIKTRVSNLKGSIEIESKPQEGMETRITIPDVDKLKTNG